MRKARARLWQDEFSCVQLSTRSGLRCKGLSQTHTLLGTCLHSPVARINSSSQCHATRRLLTYNDKWSEISYV